MKIRHIVIASVALALGRAAFAEEAPQAAADCAALQAQFDQPSQRFFRRGRTPSRI